MGASTSLGSVQQTQQARSFAEQQERLLSFTAPTAQDISSVASPTIFHHNQFECFFLQAAHLFVTNRSKAICLFSALQGASLSYR